MRHLCLAVVCIVLLACEDILPVENVDLCEGDRPASSDCTQCKADPIPQGCPQCRNGSPDPKCENADPQGGSGVTGGTGAKGGGAASTGGSTDAGRSGTGGSGGTSGTSGTGDSGSGSSGTTAAGQGGMSGSGEGGTGDGGTGGTAGSDAPAKCTGPADCENPSPQCNPKGVCVACTNNAACADRTETPRCDTRVESGTRGQCVQCTGNSGCVGDDTKPECGAGGECVACTSDDGCSARGDKHLCDKAKNSPTKGQCFECLVNSDCPNVDKPECNSDHVCSPCTGDDACADRLGATKCNQYEGAETFGHCVECTGDNEADVCDGNSCKRSTGTCTTRPRGMTSDCQPCDADSECIAGAKCVAQDFVSADVGSFCFFVDDDTRDCGDVDVLAHPYSTSTHLTSVDGVDAAYCMPITTCAAISDATAMGVNGGKACSAITDCGDPDLDASLDDGFCSAGSKCTYICQTDADCPRSGFTSCKSFGPAKACALP